VSNTHAAAADPVCAGSADAAPGAGQAPGPLIAGTEPYPWPYDGRFCAQRCALLVVSDGEPFPAGSGPTGSAVVDAVLGELVPRSLAAGVMVVGVITGRAPRGSQQARESGSGLGWPDARDGGAAAWQAGPRVTAAGWDGFYGSPLDDVLRAAGRTQLLLTGRLLETGVHSTLRSANDRGYECLTIGDACASYSAATARGALSSITMSGGIFGAIGTSADVLAVLAAVSPQTGLRVKDVTR
jgi:nicotinamidase-related amidase